MKECTGLDAVSARQLFSAVGQIKLMNRYDEFFGGYGLRCGQVLTMKESFSTRRHYLNQKQCMEVMLEHGIVPVVNENDTVSVTELMFTDNDELSGLVATMMGVDVLLILSNVDGYMMEIPLYRHLHCCGRLFRMPGWIRIPLYRLPVLLWDAEA